MFWCINQNKNVKTMLFSNKTILYKCLMFLKTAYSGCFGLRGNLEFPDFSKKSFITSTTELLIALKMVNYCCFGLRGNLDFPDFLQKSFITSTKTISRGNLSEECFGFLTAATLTATATTSRPSLQRKISVSTWKSLIHKSKSGFELIAADKQARVIPIKQIEVSPQLNSRWTSK